MKNQLTTVAALPGSGSGCQSALPAEKPMERARPHLEVTTIGAVVGSYFGYPPLGGQGSPIIGSAVDPSEAAPEKLEAPDPLDAWFQPGEVTYMTGLNSGRALRTYEIPIAEVHHLPKITLDPNEVQKLVQMLKGPRTVHRWKDHHEGEPINPGPDLLDVAGGGE